MSWSLCSTHAVSSIALLTYGRTRHRRSTFRICASSDGVEPKEEPILDIKPPESPLTSSSSSSSPSALGKDLKKVVNKTAATFAPRASTASKNPAIPGTPLYKVFEVQGYASMLVGGVLSYNLLFPSNEPDIWRLMGMWSIWMFTIPSLRARDCPSKEKEALNYLFLIIPLLNVVIPFFYKSFALVWSADTVAFFAMYAWKVLLLQNWNDNLLDGYLWCLTFFFSSLFASYFSLDGWKEQSRAYS